MRLLTRGAMLVAAGLLGCGRKDGAPIGPVPDKSPPTPAPSPAPTATKLPDLVVSDVTCTYGGTAPAFFVWAEVTARGELAGLRASTFDVTDKGGAWVSGALSTIELRRRKGKNGAGDVEPLKAPLHDGEAVHLEVSGALHLGPFGSTATYPTDDRPFRVELAAGAQRWLLTGTCKVGPAG
ncbi:MAG: hypothetical protein JST00_41005 [Deltaproteobacteria bacterium]|nr:hypothetical protein [Deltaproteobacteria bacterium]